MKKLLNTQYQASHFIENIENIFETFVIDFIKFVLAFPDVALLSVL